MFGTAQKLCELGKKLKFDRQKQEANNIEHTFSQETNSAQFNPLIWPIRCVVLGIVCDKM